MKIAVSKWFVFALLLMMVGSCKKPSSNAVTGGGKGGNETIIVTAEHASYILDTATVYIKYGTLDAPSDGVFDDSSVCVLIGGKPEAIFTNLTTGNYYFLAKGYHANISPWPTVEGGKSFTVTTERTDSLVIPTVQYDP